eukprot:COSAG04_NODE_1779_length_5595_cov_1.888464_4_plen_1114_part_00
MRRRRVRGRGSDGVVAQRRQRRRGGFEAKMAHMAVQAQKKEAEQKAAEKAAEEEAVRRRQQEQAAERQMLERLTSKQYAEPDRERDRELAGLDVEPQPEPEDEMDFEPEPEPEEEAAPVSEEISFAKEPPEELFVDEGGSVQAEAVASGGYPDEPLQYEWFHESKSLETQRTGVLRLVDASAESGGTYVVAVWCESQPDRKRSRAVKLTVTGIGVMAKVQAIIREKGDRLTEDRPRLVVLDFAGQRMYYVLHQILLTAALTRYVVAVSLEHDLDAELDGEDRVFGMTHRSNLQFWLHSIHARAPKAQILVVCTKLDLVDEELREQRVDALLESFEGQAYESQIWSVKCVSSKSGEGVGEVRQMLQDGAKPYDPSDGSGLDRYGDPVPLGWFKFHSIVTELVAKHERRISFDKVQQIGKACEIHAEGELCRMLTEFHDLGLIMWHSTAGRRDLCVLDPQWMIDQMTALLCLRSIMQKRRTSRGKRGQWTELQKQGRLSIDLLPELWPDLELWERQSVIKYMVGFGHCCLLHDPTVSAIDIVDRSVFLVPTLLPSPPADVGTIWTRADTDASLRVSFTSSSDGTEDDAWAAGRRFLPDTLFFRLVASLVQDVKDASDAFKDLYNDRVVIRTRDERYLLQHHRDQHELQLTVFAGPGCESRPAAVLCTLNRCLSGMADDLRVQFRFEVECERMGEQGWHDLNALSSDHELSQRWQVEALSASPEPEPEPEDHTDPPAGPAPPRFPVLSMTERTNDYFINHCQKSGQDQCANLHKLLTATGAKVWYDMQEQDLTAQGMEEGVSQSRNVLIFLSDDCMGRPFCNAEQRWAKQYGCNLIGVVEKDDRHGKADFGKEKERAPSDLKHLLDEVEFIDYERRDYKAKAMVDELVRRGGVIQVDRPDPIAVQATATAGLASLASPATPKRIVMSCPEMGTLDPYENGPFDQRVMDKIEEMSKRGKVKMGFDRAGTTTTSPKDKDVDWTDSEQVRKSEWMYGFKTAAKAIIRTESQGFDGLMEVLCINGGPVTQVEAEEMAGIIADAKADAAKSGVQVRIQLRQMSFFDFLAEFDGPPVQPQPAAVSDERQSLLDGQATDSDAVPEGVPPSRWCLCFCPAPAAQ